MIAEIRASFVVVQFFFFTNKGLVYFLHYCNCVSISSPDNYIMLTQMINVRNEANRAFNFKKYTLLVDPTRSQVAAWSEFPCNQSCNTCQNHKCRQSHHVNFIRG